MSDDFEDALGAALINTAARVKLLHKALLEERTARGEAAAEIKRLRARVAELECACRLIQADPDPHAVVECTGCYRHSRLAFHALEAKP